LADDALIEAIAEHVEVTPSTIRRTLAQLENAGLLVRQADIPGNAIRITPDVLADHILVMQSLTPDGEPTGYASELVKAFGAARMPALLRNFAELDWRVRQTRENAQSGVDEIWQAFEEQFIGPDVNARDTLLEILEDVAYYQPARALALIGPRVLGHDQSSTMDAKTAERYARILQRVGYTVKHLRDCIDLLLRVGAREENATRERGANHILMEIANYDLHKPPEVQRIVLDVVEEWLSRDDAFLGRAVNIVRSLLAKTGMNTTSDKRHLYFRSFSVSAASVSSLRIRARRILEAALGSDTPSLVHRALSLLCEDVCEPLQTFGQQLSESARAAWLPERLATLEVIERAMGAGSDPVFRLAVRDGLVWHARHGSGPIHERVKVLLHAIPDDFEQRLTKVLGGDVIDRMSETFDYERDVREFENAASRVAAEYVAAVPQPTSGCADLEGRLDRIVQWKSPTAGPFFDALSRQKPSYALEVLRHALQSESPRIVGYLPTIFCRVRNELSGDAEQVFETASRGPSNAREGIARALAWCALDLRPHEENGWRALLRDEQPFVRRSALAALRSLAQVQPRAALALALTARFDGEEQREAHLVEELCSLALSLEDEVLDDDSIRATLTIIGRASSISEHWIRQFVARAARRCPTETVRMLMRRVEAGKRWDDAYEALPFESLREELSHLKGCADYEVVLREIIELGSKRGHVQYHATRIFRDVAPLDMDTTAKLLRGHMEGGSAEEVEFVADLLGALPGLVLTEHVALIAAVLQMAHAIGEDSVSRVEGSVRRALVPTRWESVVGEADPDQVEAMHRAGQLAASLPVGSPERELFDAVSASIGQTIEGHLRRDEEWLDE
jgi:hypothetical protein